MKNQRLRSNLNLWNLLLPSLLLPNLLPNLRLQNVRLQNLLLQRGPQCQRRPLPPLRYHLHQPGLALPRSIFLKSMICLSQRRLLSKQHMCSRHRHRHRHRHL